MITLSRLLIVLWLCAGSVLVIGCKDEGTPASDTPTLSGDDAADLVAASLGGSTSTNGLTAQLEEAAVIAGGGGFPGLSSVNWDTTIVRADTIGNYSYHYAFDYSITFSNLGNRLDVGYNMHGVYSTPRMSSDDSAAAAITVTHIIDPDTQYTVNETYLRLGSQVSKVGRQRRFSSQISVTLVDVKVSKTTHRINSGTATVAVTGQVEGGGSFSYAAAIVFSGNQQATLTIGSAIYAIDLSAGTATRI